MKTAIITEDQLKRLTEMVDALMMQRSSHDQETGTDNDTINEGSMVIQSLKEEMDLRNESQPGWMSSVLKAAVLRCQQLQDGKMIKPGEKITLLADLKSCSAERPVLVTKWVNWLEHQFKHLNS